MKQTVVSLLITESIYMFQDSVLSISKPRNLRWETSTVSLVLQESKVLLSAEFFVMTCILKVFKKWIDNRFDLNHLSTILRFTLSFVSRVSGLVSVTSRLVSSAKTIGKAESAVAWGRSLI
jgi:hypothetical protein